MSQNGCKASVKVLLHCRLRTVQPAHPVYIGQQLSFLMCGRGVLHCHALSRSVIIKSVEGSTPDPDEDVYTGASTQRSWV